MSENVPSPLTGSLRLPGPIDVIDRAFFLARGLSLSGLLRAWLAAALPAFALLSVYVIERVEGVRSLRPLLAALLVSSWVFRALLLSDVSHACGRALGLRSNARASRHDVLRSATLSGFGALLWALPFAGLAKLSPFAPLLAVPLLSLRGLIAPSWLARPGNAAGGGFRAWWNALSDVEGARATFFFVEFLSLIGALALFANVFAILSFVLLLGHAFFGLDVAFTSAFLSPENPFVLLVVGAATFVVLEPFRVACSSLAYASAITRRDGGDLDTAIEGVIERHHARTQRHGQAHVGRALAILIAIGAASWSGQVSAQAEPASDPHDEQVRERVDNILQRSEFVELADTDRTSFAKMVEGWFEDLGKFLRELLERDPADAENESPFALPSPDPWVVLGVGLAVLTLIAAYIFLKRDRADDAAQDDNSNGDATIDPTTPPAQWLDDAQRLAASGDFHAALRALYVATIVSLDRRGLIRFEPATTNWQYQRQLPRGELRGAFAHLTRVFDLKHYGKQHTTADDYTACRSLAEQLCREPSP